MPPLTNIGVDFGVPSKNWPSICRAPIDSAEFFWAHGNIRPSLEGAPQFRDEFFQARVPSLKNIGVDLGAPSKTRLNLWRAPTNSAEFVWVCGNARPSLRGRTTIPRHIVKARMLPLEIPGAET